MSGAAPMLVLGAAAPWRFEHPAALLFLTAVPVVALGLWLAFARQRRGLLRFAGATPQETRPAARRVLVRIGLWSAGLAALVVAIARPQADPVEETVTVRGRDIVFVIDVSRSMLSRDVVPDRLGRTKLWINDLVNTLKGDRVGLVAFAGVPVVKCPLTLDLGFFRMELEELSPGSVPRGGTLIGDAIRKTMSEVFEANPGRYRDIVLVTDGEDQGSFPLEAAKAAGDAGIRIIAIGIGSELEGALVPSEGSGANGGSSGTKGYVVHDGTQVRSRMDSTTLAGVARAAREAGGGGVFLNVGTGTMDFDKVYHDLIASGEQRETDNKTSVTYRELFPWFLGLAAVCLGLEPLVGTRVRVKGAAGVRGTLVGARTGAVAACLMVGMFGTEARAHNTGAKPGGAPGQKKAAPEKGSEGTPSAADWYNEGRELFLKGKFAEAAERFREADRGAKDSVLANRARFNLGQSLLKQATTPPGQGNPGAAVKVLGPDGADESAAGAGQEAPKPLELLDGAARAFRSALEVDPSDAQAAKNVEIARRLMQELKEQEQKQQQDGKEQDSKDQQGKDGENKDQRDSKDSKDKKGQDQKGKDGKGGKSKEQQQAEQQEQEHQQNAEDLKNLAKQQEQAAEKSGEAGQQQDAQKKQEKLDESKQQQDQVNKRTEQEKKQQQETGSEGAKEKMEQARKEQEQANQKLKEGDAKGAEEHQKKAAELLEQAAGDEQKAADQAKQQAEAAKAKEEKPKYDQQASATLDKERKQREARQQMLRALRGKPQPVDKDW